MSILRFISWFPIFLFVIIFQQDVQGMSLFPTQIIEKATSELISPLSDVTNQMNDVLDEVEQKKVEYTSSHQDTLRRLSKAPAKCRGDQAILEHATILQSWNFDSCVDLTDDCEEGSELAIKGGEYVSDLTQMLGKVGSGVVDCPTLDPSVTIKCFHSYIKDLQDFMVTYKNNTVPLLTRAVEVANKIRVDFDHCVGIPITSQSAIEQHLKNC